MRIEKKTLNDALRVLGKVVCQTSPVERQTTAPVTNPALAGAGGAGGGVSPLQKSHSTHTRQPQHTGGRNYRQKKIKTTS